MTYQHFTQGGGRQLGDTEIIVWPATAEAFNNCLSKTKRILIP